METIQKRGPYKNSIVQSIETETYRLFAEAAQRGPTTKQWVSCRFM